MTPRTKIEKEAPGSDIAKAINILREVLRSNGMAFGAVFVNSRDGFRGVLFADDMLPEHQQQMLRDMERMARVARQRLQQ